MKTEFYLSEYTNSWALVVGINTYKVFPLHYARKDAEAVAGLLISQLGFPKDNVKLLVDGKATKKAIVGSFLEFTRDKVQPNDRVLFYFAGHGHTKTGNRGDIGFLVPVDGNWENLASLIRWDELTRNAELIAAKHVLFIMDACYGGLALTRTLTPGSMRFLKDMLQRYARQVITAGKADEPVLDLGGPLPEHSVFTGHLLEGLQGRAVSSEGILTANGVMSYVYEKVSKDSDSHQTPHFGFLDGDGDFIFEAPPLSTIPDEPETAQDLLVEIPITQDTSLLAGSNLDLVSTTKEYISDDKYRIKLDDLSIQYIKKVKSLTTDSHFPINIPSKTNEEFLKKFSSRLDEYESLTYDLQVITTLLAHWGGSVHISTIRKIMTRMSEWPKHQSGTVAWLNLRWYPTVLLMYSGGIGAIAADNYESLSAIFITNSGSVSTYAETDAIIIETNKAISEIDELFKQLPGHERQYVPKSEYLFKTLQPILDDLMFLGTSYEEIFDRFEIFQALVYADLLESKRGRIWGPFGRFAWKHREQSREFSPYTKLLLEAKAQQDNWPPLKAGFFRGSYLRFETIANQYEESIARLNWF